jgi:hypothetical protein
MITKNQALSVNDFHYGTCTRETGPRGGVKERIERWRRNGSTQTWKTRPREFRLPVKYGMRGYSVITQDNASDFHTEADCPLNGG